MAEEINLLIPVYYRSYIFLWTFYILENVSLGKSKSEFHSYDSFPLSATDKSNNILRSINKMPLSSLGFRSDVIIKEQRLRL